MLFQTNLSEYKKTNLLFIDPVNHQSQSKKVENFEKIDNSVQIATP